MIVDAETLGDRYSAKHNKVSERTVRNYRAQYSADPKVAELCRLLRVRINEGWIESGRAARLRLIERQLEVAEGKNVALKDLTNALRRTHEVVMSHEIVNGDPTDAERHLAGQSEDPREAEGTRRTGRGGEDPSDSG